MQLLHIPLLVREALGKGATKENIESGFKVTGICPFNDSIFKDTDFILLEVEKENKEMIYVESQYTEDEQRRIVVVNENDDLELAATEIVSTTDESTPGPKLELQNMLHCLMKLVQ